MMKQPFKNLLLQALNNSNNNSNHLLNNSKINQAPNNNNSNNPPVEMKVAIKRNQMMMIQVYCEKALFLSLY
jgi:hypothetical protein